MKRWYGLTPEDEKTFWDIVTPTGAGLVHSTTSRDVYELLKSGGIEPDEIQKVAPTCRAYHVPAISEYPHQYTNKYYYTR